MLYTYQAIDSQGKARNGMIDATSEKEARDKLREQKILITFLKQKGRQNHKCVLKGDQLFTFTLQLAQLLDAGLPLYESLIALESQYRTEDWHPILVELCDRVKRGENLSDAMSKRPQSFNSLYCAMIAAGESTGSLSAVCQRLSLLLDRQQKIKKQISTALIYPIVLGSFAMVVVTLLMVFVIPSIENLFEGRQLNGFTGVVLAASRAIRNYWPLGFIFIGASVGIYYLKKVELIKQFHRYSLKMPIIKQAVIKTAVARFTRTMGTLQEGGVPLIESLKIARRVLRCPPIEKIIEDAEQKIIEGSSLGKELLLQNLIPPLVTRMILVGEETGDLATMFHKIADIYEEEVEKTLTAITALIQPAILLIMGGVVGIVMLAVLLPLTDVSSLTG
ncbi:MAG: type II secretion system F family protein [Parachlamydiales bacterium]|nr:type II secretion system F family protein [Parachlamydiales bacterium]